MLLPLNYIKGRLLSQISINNYIANTTFGILNKASNRNIKYIYTLFKSISSVVYQLDFFSYKSKKLTLASLRKTGITGEIQRISK